MNERKFCFIICANKERELEECLWYIGNLALPEGYEKEEIIIRGASSMTSGYNQAMAQSDAKYKIYIHQDVLLVNRNLLTELLTVFQDASIGMVGCIGRKDFMRAGEYTTSWDAGTVEVCNVADTYRYEWRLEENEKWMDVISIDGIFMATQYDLPWDEENFDGWDFYDISQSAVFHRSGYRIVVPCVPNEELWCFHDSGQSEYYEWDRYRKIFCERYASEGYRYEVIKWGRVSEDTLEKRRQVKDAFEAGDFEKTNQYLNELGGENFDTKTAYIMLFMLITLDEWIELGRVSFSDVESFQEFIVAYDEVKFMLRRIYFGIAENEAWQTLQDKLNDGAITMRMLYQAVQTCVYDSDRLWQKIYGRFQKMIRLLLEQGEVLQVEQLLSQLKRTEREKAENLLLALIQIFKSEVEKDAAPTVFDTSRNVDELAAHYIRLERDLRQMAQKETDDQKFYDYIIQTGVSDELMLYIIKEAIPYPKRLFQKLAELFVKNEGEKSLRAKRYTQLAESTQGQNEIENRQNNERKICFVICANDERYLEECLWYIDKLRIPEGYKKEKAVIRGASSMTGGYNQAMAQSDAKYKIYLHQDVLIVNENILYDLLEIFQDDSIGMVGVVGKKELASSGAYAREWDAGAVNVCNATECYAFDWSSGESEKRVDVTGIDGMFMATQYDLPWDEKNFDGWDFYDLSQSMNIRQAGYRIVVPCIRKEEEPWVFHDAGQCEYVQWEKYRKIFCEVYAALGHEYIGMGMERQNAVNNEKRKEVMKAFESGDFERTTRCLESLGADNLNSELAYVVLFLKVRAEELMAFGETNYSTPERMPAFIREYDEVKFMLRRIYFGYGEAAWEYLQKGICDGQFSMKMICAVSYICVFDASRLWWDVFARYQELVYSLIWQGEVLAAEKLLMQLDKEWRGKAGNILLILIGIFRREVEKNVPVTVFDVSQNPDELVAHYIRVKYYLRRLEFGLPMQYWNEAYEYCKKTGVSDYLILHILRNNIFYKKELCRNLSQLFAKEEGAGSMRANLYAQLAEQQQN